MFLLRDRFRVFPDAICGLVLLVRDDEGKGRLFVSGKSSRFDEEEEDLMLRCRRDPKLRFPDSFFFEERPSFLAFPVDLEEERLRGLWFWRGTGGEETGESVSTTTGGLSDRGGVGSGGCSELARGGGPWPPLSIRRGMRGGMRCMVSWRIKP